MAVPLTMLPICYTRSHVLGASSMHWSHAAAQHRMRSPSAIHCTSVGQMQELAQQFHRSTQLTYSLREKQRLLSDGGQSFELIQSCPTRWGSTFLMLDRIQVLQQALCAVLLDQPREVRYLLPDSEEWTIIEELIDVLKPFHRTTTAMSASSYPTLSMLSPLLYKRYSRWEKMTHNQGKPSKKQFY